MMHFPGVLTNNILTSVHMSCSTLHIFHWWAGGCREAYRKAKIYSPVSMAYHFLRLGWHAVPHRLENNKLHCHYRIHLRECPTTNVVASKSTLMTLLPVDKPSSKLFSMQIQFNETSAVIALRERKVGGKNN